jgi:endo-1,3-1,4-beta-glycanase ExoK
MKYRCLPLSLGALVLTVAAQASAVASAELYQNQTYTYGRFEARIRFAASDGVISSFFLWKPGSEMAGTFWNELDFEKLGPVCRLQTNPLYGLPVADHHVFATLDADLCGEYHTYTFEWTPSYIAYLVDGVEVRRDGEDVAAAFAQNAASGMQIHFNIWPGDATFGGNFDAANLPLQQYISWVQYSSFADGAFALQWREEFDGPTLPSGWAVGNWASPKNHSTHQAANVGFVAGTSVLSLTADDALGFVGTPPPDLAAGGEPDPGQSTGGAGGTPGTGGGAAPPPALGVAGSTNLGGTGDGAGGSGNAGNAGGSTAAPVTGGAPMSADGTSAAGSSAVGTSAAPSSRRPSGGGSCSHVVSSSTRPAPAWLALAGAALVAIRRRQHWLKKGRHAE